MLNQRLPSVDLSRTSRPAPMTREKTLNKRDLKDEAYMDNDTKNYRKRVRALLKKAPLDKLVEIRLKLEAMDRKDKEARIKRKKMQVIKGGRA
jgi:hypothetical protein